MNDKTPDVDDGFDWDAVLGTPGPTPDDLPPADRKLLDEIEDESTDVVDAEIVCELDDCPRADEPHSYDPDDGCPDFAKPPTEIEVSSAILDVNAADQLLDALGNDHRALADTAGNLRETLLQVVRERNAARRAARIAKLDGQAPTATTDVRHEAVGAANDAETLTVLAGSFTAAAADAKAIAGDLLDDLPGRGGKPRASFKVADGSGFELIVKREPNRELSVKHDEVVDVLAAHLIAGLEGSVTAEHAATFAAGVRSGIDALRDVLASSPTYRSTALDALATTLENRSEDDLAKRLRKAYARVDKGEPRVKLDRTPIKAKGDDQ